MPFTMSFTDPTTITGAVYSESFWIISTIILNQIQRTATLQFNGYNTVEDFFNGGKPIGSQNFTFNDPVIYSQFLKYQFEIAYAGQFGVYYDFEHAVQENFDFFTGFTSHWAVVGPIHPEVPAFDHTLEVGEQNQDRVAVVFSAPGISENDTGVTISINGVPATVTGSSNDVGYNAIRTRNFYDITPAVAPGDEVTWSYDAAVGGLQDPESLLNLHSWSNLSAVNTVGSYLRFDQSGNSGALLVLGIL